MRNGGYTIFNYVAWLWMLLGAFVFRVLAQLLQATSPVSWLPGFEQWQGSHLPYPVLLSSQVLIICALLILIGRLARGRFRACQQLGRGLLLLGGLYFAAMLLRLVLGLTLLSSVSWFGKPIPAFFHLVLASIVLLIGHYHCYSAQGARTE